MEISGKLSVSCCDRQFFIRTTRTVNRSPKYYINLKIQNGVINRYEQNTFTQPLYPLKNHLNYCTVFQTLINQKSANPNVEETIAKFMATQQVFLKEIHHIECIV